MSVLFQCDHLTKILPGFRLEEISFAVEPGEIVGVIGVNGSGKSTLFHTIMGRYRLRQEGENGHLVLCGYGIGREDLDASKSSVGNKKRKTIQLSEVKNRAINMKKQMLSHLPGSCFTTSDAQRSCAKNMKKYRQEIAFVEPFSPFGNLQYPWEVGENYGRFYPRFDMERYKTLLREFGIAGDGRESFQREKKYISIGNLSTGQQIKQQLAFAMATDASLYLLDEPAGNLDVDFRQAFYEMLREIVSDEKHSILFASHIVEELETFVDKLLWLDREEDVSRVRYFGTIDALRDRYRIVEAEDDKLYALPEDMIVGGRLSEYHNEVLVDLMQGDLPGDMEMSVRYADLNEIIYYNKRNKIQIETSVGNE